MLLVIFAVFVIHSGLRQVLVSGAVSTAVQDHVWYMQNKHRCTRRFTPGVCIDPVNSVWTFEFQIMNCTEKLGCPQSRRSNRFQSYETCARRCQSVIQLYLQILSYSGSLDKDSDTWVFLRNKPQMSLRRGGTVDFKPKSPSQPAPDDEEYPGDEALMARIMYDDKEDNKQEDVDFVPKVRDPDDYFAIH